MESNYSGHVATVHLTVNGQSLSIALDSLGGHIEGTQRSDYVSRAGVKVPTAFYGGYESGRIHTASTRTIANMIERYIKEAY